MILKSLPYEVIPKFNPIGENEKYYAFRVSVITWIHLSSTGVMGSCPEESADTGINKFEQITTKTIVLSIPTGYVWDLDTEKWEYPSPNPLRVPPQPIKEPVLLNQITKILDEVNEVDLRLNNTVIARINSDRMQTR